MHVGSDCFHEINADFIGRCKVAPHRQEYILERIFKDGTKPTPSTPLADKLLKANGSR
jgi:hypothetical protein